MVAEVTFHRTRELGCIGIHKDPARCVELLANVIGDFPDLGDEPSHPALNPEPDVRYPEGRTLTLALWREEHRGLV